MLECEPSTSPPTEGAAHSAHSRPRAWWGQQAETQFPPLRLLGSEKGPWVRGEDTDAPSSWQGFQLALLRRPGVYKPLVIGISLMAFQQLSGVNAIMFYAKTIFEEAKFKVRGLCPACLMPHV